ncbi:SCO2525 family SAM-dependent methyltransferase [Actinocrispum sp. NPDC049592]|uniref:SCO2525 family SAM-dependent methyltransferase n=1 Tax=Actinocrispum sp. NPDC049592 TaxID=3154835 RepID=UPI00341BD799
MVPGGGKNDDIDWDGFDPATYYAQNYRSLRDDDRHILECVRDHFADAAEKGRLPSGAVGIDIGTGPNLYPALTMLPFCANVTLYERAQSNIDWLSKQQKAVWPTWDDGWDKFWQVLLDREPYQRIAEPWRVLADRATIVRGSVFDLPTEPRYDIGTMFFVAESITNDEGEFRSAIDHLLRVLKPGAPFAIACMEHSAGYKVGTHQFPAIDIDALNVADCLAYRVVSKPIAHIGHGNNPIRDGYTGMLIALGRVKEEAEALNEVAAATADPGRVEGRRKVFAAS